MSDIADRILADCRGAIGEVRFGFGSKRQVWAFEDRHQLDAAALSERLAGEDPPQFLRMAVAFHDEFAVVSNAWRVRERIQQLTSELCRDGSAGLLAEVANALVDDKLAVRHWLVAAFLNGPVAVVLEGLERALLAAYQPQDQWALLARLKALSQQLGRHLGADTERLLTSLAQLSPRPEERILALELLAGHCGAEASMCLARAARGDVDPDVRHRAAELLKR